MITSHAIRHDTDTRALLIVDYDMGIARVFVLLALSSDISLGSSSEVE
jgi:hypothetical protein